MITFLDSAQVPRWFFVNNRLGVAPDGPGNTSALSAQTCAGLCSPELRDKPTRQRGTNGPNRWTDPHWRTERNDCGWIALIWYLISLMLAILEWLHDKMYRGKNMLFTESSASLSAVKGQPPVVWAGPWRWAESVLRKQSSVLTAHLHMGKPNASTLARTDFGRGQQARKNTAGMK